MYSFAVLKIVSHMCVGVMGFDLGGVFKDGEERGGTNIMQDGTLTCSRGLEWVEVRTCGTVLFGFIDPHVLSFSFNNVFVLLCRFKIYHLKELMNVCLFFGLLAWLHTKVEFTNLFWTKNSR
jgi:hypothetical protein